MHLPAPPCSAVPAHVIPIFKGDKPFDGSGKPLRKSLTLPSWSKLAGKERLELDMQLSCPGTNDTGEMSLTSKSMQSARQAGMAGKERLEQSCAGNNDAGLGPLLLYDRTWRRAGGQRALDLCMPVACVATPASCRMLVRQSSPAVCMQSKTCNLPCSAARDLQTVPPRGTLFVRGLLRHRSARRLT